MDLAGKNPVAPEEGEMLPQALGVASEVETRVFHHSCLCFRHASRRVIRAHADLTIPRVANDPFAFVRSRELVGLDAVDASGTQTKFPVRSRSEVL